MTFRKWAVRVIRLAGVVTVSLVLIAFLAVQIQQRMLRWRAERLLAEMHQIRLYQSTWADAQRLMHRWGAWGHYDGGCTAQSCKYEIELDSITFYNPRIPRHAWLDWLLMHDRFNIYQCTQQAFEAGPEHLHRLALLRPDEWAHVWDLCDYMDDLLYTEIQFPLFRFLLPVCLDAWREYLRNDVFECPRFAEAFYTTTYKPREGYLDPCN
jgi:hypothetical protein